MIADVVGVLGWLALCVLVRLGYEAWVRWRGSAPPMVDRITMPITKPCDFCDQGHPIEETRLMPGANQRDLGDEDQVPEGLGIVRPRPRYRRDTSPVVPHWSFDPSAQHALEELEREAHS